MTADGSANTGVRERPWKARFSESWPARRSRGQIDHADQRVRDAARDERRVRRRPERSSCHRRSAASLARGKGTLRCRSGPRARRSPSVPPPEPVYGPAHEMIVAGDLIQEEAKSWRVSGVSASAGGNTTRAGSCMGPRPACIPLPVCVQARRASSAASQRKKGCPEATPPARQSSCRARRTAFHLGVVDFTARPRPARFRLRERVSSSYDSCRRGRCGNPLPAADPRWRADARRSGDAVPRPRRCREDIGREDAGPARAATAGGEKALAELHPFPRQGIDARGATVGAAVTAEVVITDII